LVERSIEVHLGDLTVDENATRILVEDGPGEGFYLTEKVERAFARFLGVPMNYLEKCPPELKAHNLNYWLQAKAGATAVIETVNNQFVTVHKSGLTVIPLNRVVEVISDNLDPNYQVVDLTRGEDLFQLDVITDHQIEVEPREDIEDRNPVLHTSVGDITHGGIRFRSNPTKAEPPVVQTYLHRLWCSNGATSPIAEGTIKLKGLTVDDVLSEIETAMNRAIGDLDAKLASYAALATKQPPGSKENFARQLGNEHKIPARVLNKILDRVEVLPEDATLYDIMNIFTSMANEEGIRYETMLKLQELGGALAMDTDAVTHRCGTCERLLP